MSYGARPSIPLSRDRITLSRWRVGTDTQGVEAASGIMSALGFILQTFWSDPDPEVTMMGLAAAALRQAIWAIHHGFSDPEFSAINTYAGVTYAQALNTVRSVYYFGDSDDDEDKEFVGDMCYTTGMLARRTLALVWCVFELDESTLNIKQNIIREQTGVDACRLEAFSGLLSALGLVSDLFLPDSDYVLSGIEYHPQ